MAKLHLLENLEARHECELVLSEGVRTLRSSLERSCEVDRGTTDSQEEMLDELLSSVWEPSDSSEDMSAVGSGGRWCSGVGGANSYCNLSNGSLANENY